MENNKLLQVTTKEVSCSGDSYSKHPLIYLKIAEDKKEIVCPYCSKVFLYVENNLSSK